MGNFFKNLLANAKSAVDNIGTTTLTNPFSSDYKQNLVSPRPQDWQQSAPQALAAEAPTPSPSPTPTPQATPSASFQDLQNNIKAGLTKWGRGTAPPVATLSGELASVGQDLPDPYMPVIQTLVESRGLQDSIPQANANPYNIFYPGTETPVDYQGQPGVAITGGQLGNETKLGFKGLLRNGGLYDDYRKSGKLEDFFKRYSPPGDGNASMEEQIARYNQIRRDYFE